MFPARSSTSRSVAVSKVKVGQSFLVKICIPTSHRPHHQHAHQHDHHDHQQYHHDHDDADDDHHHSPAENISRWRSVALREVNLR